MGRLLILCCGATLLSAAACLPGTLPDGGGTVDGGDGDGDLVGGDGDGDGDAGAMDAGMDAGAEPDLTELLFDPERLIEVELTMAPEAWDDLRFEARSLLNIFGPGCTAQPFPNVFNWYEGDVVIDGEAIATIGVRKKGFLGSLSETRPSLKLDFDRLVDGQRYQDASRMTLNNARQDPSFVRTCLAYQLFAAAGVPAPRCNFATVSVNGEDLGVYVHVEPIKRPFIRRHFDDDRGLLYEGTLSDFREGWSDTLEQKVDENMPDFTVPDGIAEALLATDEDLLAALEPWIDVDTFLTFWATEVLVSHWDGYAGNTNNYYLYADPADGKANFLPWGTDATMAPGVLLFESLPAPVSVLASGLLARRLYFHPEVQPLYLDRLQELLDTVFHEDMLQAEVDRMEALIAPAVPLAQRPDHEAALLITRGYIDDLREAIAGETESGPYVWDVPLRDVPCLPDVGSFSGSFSTTFGTFPAADYLQTGDGSLGGTVAGNTLDLVDFGSGIGFNEAEDRVTLIIVGTEAAGSAVFVVATMDRDLYAPGVVDIDDVRCQASINRFTPGGGIVPLGYVYDGSLLLDEASVVGTSAASGSLLGALTIY